MLEALIRTKNSRAYDKGPGDVICIKLEGFADWGSMETRVHQVVPWIDDELELQLREEIKKTGTVDARITPYKQVETVDFVNYRGDLICSKEVTKTRSYKYFNIESIEDPTLKKDVIRDDCYVEPYFFREIDIQKYISQKTEEEIIIEFEYNKNQIKNSLLEV